MALARLIRTAAGVVAAVIVIGIVLKLVGANPHNVVVSDIHDAGAWLTSPFNNVFTVKSANWHIVLNWGLAALVYLIVGGLIASLLARSTPSWRYRRVGPAA